MECAVVAAALEAAGAEVRLHSDYFAHDERDEVWLPEVAREGWVILTKDKAIRRRPIERNALIASGARTFVLTSGNMRGDEMAQVLIGHLRRMERVVARTKPPFIAIVTRTAVQVLDL